MNALIVGQAPPAAVVDRRVSPRDWVFLSAALIAPLDVVISKSFTVSDLMLLGVASLILLGPGRLQWPPPVFLAAVLVFALFALVSSFRATHPGEALTQLAQFIFIFFVLLPVVLTVVRTPRMLELTIGALAVGSFAGIVVSLVADEAAGGGRVLAFFSDNSNRLGYPTAYLLPFVLHYVSNLWMHGRRRSAVVIGGFAGYLMIWALAASGSRGAALGSLVAVVVYAAFLDGFRVDGRAARRVLACAAALGAVALLVFNTSWFPETLQERIERTFGAEDSLVQDRERLANAGLRAFEESPFVGTGLDNFRHVATRYDDLVTSQAPHNMWLQFLAQVGVVGTLAFAFLIVTWFELLLRRQAALREHADRRLMSAFIASMAALMVIFMTTPIMIHRHYWLLYGLGLVAALGYPDGRSREVGGLGPSAGP
jgi:O-antigen ligase